MEKQERTDLGVSLSYFINHWHCSIGIDEVNVGLNVHSVTDLQILIDWWNAAVRYERNLKDGKTSTPNQLQYLLAAIWIRINMIHPKFLLRFEDITHG